MLGVEVTSNGIEEFSYWRVWVVPDGGMRVARDWRKAPPPGPTLQPQHLELVDGRCVWRPHDQGAHITSVPREAFVAWLDQGGGD